MDKEEKTRQLGKHFLTVLNHCNYNRFELWERTKGIIIKDLDKLPGNICPDNFFPSIEAIGATQRAVLELVREKQAQWIKENETGNVPPALDAITFAGYDTEKYNRLIAEKVEGIKPHEWLARFGKWKGSPPNYHESLTDSIRAWETFTETGEACIRDYNGKCDIIEEAYMIETHDFTGPGRTLAAIYAALCQYIDTQNQC